jgi:hypothetical protein
MTIYFFTGDNSDLSVPGDNFDAVMSPDHGTDGNWVITVANGASESDYFYSEVGDPGVDGSTGTTTVYLNLSATDADLGMFVTLARVNSSGTVQSGSLESAEQSGAASRIFTFSSLNLGTWNAGDRFRLQLRCFGNQAHGNSSVTVDATAAAGGSAVSPWTLSAPTARYFIIS